MDSNRRRSARVHATEAARGETARRHPRGAPLQPDPTAARVRIVIRTHDRPVLFARALDDILAQTYREWDIVILNHRGDRAVLDEVIRSRSDRFPHRWEVIDTDHPIGRDAILEMAFADTAVEFTAIHDDDDTWAPGFLARTVSWLDDHPHQVAVAVATEIVQERVGDDAIVDLRTEAIRPPFARISLFDLLHAAHIPPIGLLLRSASVEAAGGFDPSLSVLGDWDMMLKLACLGPIGYIEGETLAFWRQRPQNEGALANSVIGDLELHRQTDRELRDRAIREYIERNGIGGLLYLARYLDEQFASSRHDTWVRIGEIEASLAARMEDQTRQLQMAMANYSHHYSLFPSLRRAFHRILPTRRRKDAAQPAE
ncbi:glycosyltransferase family 2 protein [Microbacterium sp. M3]|uniref:Glycosyltransferase family 2 protein n=1 Tax=Microbacterium arthrosphaerae TaxID=792652 RepID=A0ABU4H260_9MICO|nr:MULTISPECIES: glycosyltransferase family 2 protein [Microbacterium]MDW4573360.1 glycosyltransferase family 2 protein [Microbacterium arthrosphaerae]MDW7607215.1 glycosyltransferase family 2 protein [Microbacterium sp. M3]